MKPKRVSGHPFEIDGPKEQSLVNLLSILGAKMEPIGCHFQHRLRHFGGTLFYAFFGTLKNTICAARRYQNCIMLEVILRTFSR